MLRYKLRTLLIVLAIAPLVLAGVWWLVDNHLTRLQLARERAEMHLAWERERAELQRDAAQWKP